MPNLYRFAALSDHWAAGLLRRTYRGLRDFSVPAPRLLTRPILAVLLGLREATRFLRRVFVVEPLFKSRCASYGRNLHTGFELPGVQGDGDILLGDNVMIDGKVAIFFATRYGGRPRLIIGDNTGIGHACAFTVGREIRIGKHCRFGGLIAVFDAPGHPADPAARLAGLPSVLDEVKPIVIGDNVWVGTSSVIYPGVTIGDNSIVAMGSVVMSNVAPNVMVAGNPARMIRTLNPPPGTPAPQSPAGTA